MNQADFLRLIEEHKRILYKIANSYCRNTGDREDLIQEMIVQLWKSAARFDNHYKFSTWMYRIALNVAISFYRKADRGGVRVELGATVDLTDPGDGGSELDDRVALLHRFISELGEMDRALMILYLEERPYREIAEILGITETNVATKLTRIKDRLRKQFTSTKKI